MIRRLGMTIVGLAGALALSVWIGAHLQKRELSTHLDRLAAASPGPSGGPEGLGSLPQPVARYLRWALPQGQSIRLVRLQQAGELRTDLRSDRWMKFQSEHTVAPAAIGFVWNARVTVVPLLHVRVRDALFDGEGSGRVALQSALTVSSAAGTPEMNSGSLHRFLAEAVWYPTALFPSSKLHWSPIDDNTALATLTDHGVAVSLEFRFGATGEVTSIFTPARWGAFDGGYAQRPWEGHFRNYQSRDGIRVPLEGDVGWYVDNDWRAVWRGTIIAFDAEEGD